MGVTCRGDVTVITHMWTDRDSQPLVNQTAPHQCVDFNKVVEFSKEHVVDVFQPNYIVQSVLASKNKDKTNHILARNLVPHLSMGIVSSHLGTCMTTSSLFGVIDLKSKYYGN